MTPDELLNGYLKIYDDFYSIKNILKRKPVSKKQKMPYFLFNFGYRKFGKIASKIGMIGFTKQLEDWQEIYSIEFKLRPAFSTMVIKELAILFQRVLFLLVKFRFRPVLRWSSAELAVLINMFFIVQ